MTNKYIFREITAQSALNNLKRKIPYGWDLNIYRVASTTAASG